MEGQFVVKNVSKDPIPPEGHMPPTWDGNEGYVFPVGTKIAMSEKEALYLIEKFPGDLILVEQGKPTVHVGKHMLGTAQALGDFGDESERQRLLQGQADLKKANADLKQQVEELRAQMPKPEVQKAQKPRR